MMANDLLDQYILEHIDEEGDYLYQLYRSTNLRLLRPRMASGHLQGRILKMLVRLQHPLSVLEIGPYSGYSALCLAEGLPECGVLHTFEINDEQECFTLPLLENSSFADKIRFYIGDVLTLLPQMPELSFDMAFIDADKRCYLDYYELVLSRMQSGGLILVDNTLWDGHVVDSSYQDAQTQSIRAFNDFVARDSRVETVILPLRDGLTMLYKK